MRCGRPLTIDVAIGRNITKGNGISLCSAKPTNVNAIGTFSDFLWSSAMRFRMLPMFFIMQPQLYISAKQDSTFRVKQCSSRLDEPNSAAGRAFLPIRCRPDRLQINQLIFSPICVLYVFSQSKNRCFSQFYQVLRS